MTFLFIILVFVRPKNRVGGSDGVASPVPIHVPQSSYLRSIARNLNREIVIDKGELKRLSTICSILRWTMFCIFFGMPPLQVYDGR